MGGRRFRQAAADDGAAVYHRLDHRQSRLAQPFGAAHARPANGGGDRRPLARRDRLRVPDPAHLSVDSKRLVLQLEPGRAACRVRFPLALPHVESVPRTRQQHRAGGGAVFNRAGLRAGRRRPSRAPARRAVRGARGDCAGDTTGDTPDAVRLVCNCRQCRRHPRHPATGTAADLSGGLRRGGFAGQPLGPARAGGGAHATARATSCANRTRHCSPPRLPATCSSCCPD